MKYFVKTETNEIFGTFENEAHAKTYAANIKKKLSHQFKQFIVSTSKKPNEGIVEILKD